MRPLFHQLPTLQHQDPVRHPDRRKAIEIAARHCVAAPRYISSRPTTQMRHLEWRTPSVRSTVCRAATLVARAPGRPGDCFGASPLAMNALCFAPRGDCYLAVSCGLQLKEFRVQPTQPYQSLVRPLFHQLPTLEHQDPIRHPHRREAVGDQHCHPSFSKL
jgi:hypothetical protein